MGRSCKTRLGGLIHVHKHFYIHVYKQSYKFTKYYVSDSGLLFFWFNLNIHVSYKFDNVYFYFELLQSTDLHLPMEKKSVLFILMI